MKICSKCGETKSITLFYVGMGRCKSCHIAKTREWALANPEKVTESRKKHLSKPENRAKSNVAAKRWYENNTQRAQVTQFERGLSKYGLNLLEYNQMCARQDFRCLLCDSDETPLFVDHNHNCTPVKARGLLCNSCNRGIGLLKDNSAVLERAALYVSQ